ncbi:hypothetical protein CRYUN_Cryun30bG0080100 [Craigia yunnanensis]
MVSGEKTLKKLALNPDGKQVLVSNLVYACISFRPCLSLGQCKIDTQTHHPQFQDATQEYTYSFIRACQSYKWTSTIATTEELKFLIFHKNMPFPPFGPSTIILDSSPPSVLNFGMLPKGVPILPFGPNGLKYASPPPPPIG